MFGNEQWRLNEKHYSEAGNALKNASVSHKRGGRALNLKNKNYIRKLNNQQKPKN